MKLQTLNGKTYYVVGLGRSGYATLKALKDAGATTYAWDDTPTQRHLAQKQGATLIDPESVDWTSLDALVLSPGIPHTLPKPHVSAYMAAQFRTPIVCDIDLFFKTLRTETVIGITGTNGKSTTTALIYHILKTAGLSVAMGGNIGLPVFDIPPVGATGTYVMELSSYQLERITTPVLSTGIFLNLSPNHLDRHGDMAHYQQAKLHVFDLLKPHGLKIIGVDSPIMEAIFQSLDDPYTLPISGTRQLQKGVYVEDHTLVDHLGTLPKKVMDLSTIPTLKGVHNYQNIAASYAACRATHNLSPDVIQKGIKTYPGLPHRQQSVAHHKNITFINDSKATTLEAATKSLSAFENIYWIVGGQPKEGNVQFAPLKPYTSHIRHVYTIGESASDYHTLLSPHMPATLSRTLDQAVTQATTDALNSNAPAVVLLAPACASFDQYTDFEARGDHFVALVHKITKKKA